MSASQLENSIESSCSLTKGDVEAALSALREQMLSELSQGNRFYIPNIGYFSLSVDLDMPDGKSLTKRVVTISACETSSFVPISLCCKK